MNLKGKAGTAFKAQLPPPEDRGRFAMVACLEQWMLELPNQHPLWNRYGLSVIHLREFAGLPPAEKIDPSFTHVMMVYSVHPEATIQEFHGGTAQCLMPFNHVVQFEATSDVQAVNCARHMVQRLVNGLEFVEPSGIRGARERFGNSVNSYLNETSG